MVLGGELIAHAFVYGLTQGADVLSPESRRIKGSQAYACSCCLPMILQPNGISVPSCLSGLVSLLRGAIMWSPAVKQRKPKPPQESQTERQNKAACEKKRNRKRCHSEATA